MKRNSILIIILLCSTIANAQSWLENGEEIRNNHLYAHVDLNWGNIYPTAISSVVTGYINYALKDAFFENGMMYDFNIGKENDEKIKSRAYSPMGLDAHSMFNSMLHGFKLGYKSVNRGGFNWGIFASAHYKMNQFETKYPLENVYSRQRLQYVQAGGGILLVLGGLDKPSRVIIEAGCQYSIPIAYTGVDNNKNRLNKGLTSHFAVKLGGKSYLQNIGVFADINHFNTFDKKFEVDGIHPYENNTLRNFCVGLQLSVTFMQSERRE